MAFDPISAALDIGGKVIDRLWPDPEQANAAKLELLKLQQSGELSQITGQLDINKVEAANSSIFVAGWRPFVGWVCGAAFAYKFVAAPAVAFALTAFGVLDGAGHPIVLPVLDFTEMSTVLLGMLGIGGLRTVEKVKGVA
jgi:hypothetical protein